jgi:bifunctional DNA-binding transcriptional regulator/antitoxin component of YhaV-PrlF toxin-antitoxin module
VSRKEAFSMTETQASARITGKGQVQVPLSIRKKIGAEIGDDLLFRLTDEGQVIVELRKRPSLRQLGGAFRSERPFPGIEEEETGARKSWVARRQESTER